jgi:predicted esterase
MLLALHGVGANGTDFAGPLMGLADRNGWLLVSPTLAYRNYDNVLETRADEPVLVSQLESLLLDVPRQTKLNVLPSIVGLGFSRGAAVLQRFAMTHPSTFSAAALLAPGGITVPFACATSGDETIGLPFPLGVESMRDSAGREFDADGFREIPMWVAVGSKDTDVTTPWAAMLGRGRNERVATYAESLRRFGAHVEYTVYAQVRHEVTPGELQDAANFLKRFEGSRA